MNMRVIDGKSCPKYKWLPFYNYQMIYELVLQFTAAHTLHTDLSYQHPVTFEPSITNLFFNSYLNISNPFYLAIFCIPYIHTVGYLWSSP